MKQAVNTEKTAKDNAVSLVEYRKSLVATGYKLPRPLSICSQS